MEIKETKIGEYIFTKNTNRKKFRIPDYQRPYVWDESVEEFWLDLIDPRNNLPFLRSFIFKQIKIAISTTLLMVSKEL